MKKKKLSLKTETIREMKPASLREVVGGSDVYGNCIYVNTAIVGGLKSIDGRCGINLFTSAINPADG
jgi:hypothetical protein